ncbi:MAG: flagellar hook-associated protein FlgK [Burkholderiaceae bacterium]
MSLLSIGYSALNAAQVGVTTTSHNVANANVAGYSRQIIEQASAGGQNTGFGFVGRGTEVTTVRRIYNQFLTDQVKSSQSASSELSTYSTEISKIDNMLADPVVGVSPAMQGFFSSVQAVTSDPNSSAARQAMLSSSQSLAARFQGMASQLSEANNGVNSLISGSVIDINTASTRIADLNDAITKAMAGSTQPPNDLMDQRDQAIADLSKQVKVSVVPQGGSVDVFIGTGQTLVTGHTAAQLYTTVSPTDSTQTVVGMKSASGNNLSILPSSALTGGALGGALQYRSTTLNDAQNSLGRVAAVLSGTFNAQHKLGQTQTGALGLDFFAVGPPVVNANSNNASTFSPTAAITDAQALTTSDYSLKYASASSPSYTLTRLSDGSITQFDKPASGKYAFDGVTIDLNGSPGPAVGDEYKIKPVINGAATFQVAVTNTRDIALAAPAVSATGARNSGSLTVTAPVVQSTAVIPSGVALTYSSATGSLSGFPPQLPVTVTTGSGSTTYPPGTASIPYASGNTVSFGGVSAVIQNTSAPPSPNFTVPAPTGLLTYSAATKSISGFPIPLVVTVTTANSAVSYPPGTPVPYTPGATMSFGGVSIVMSGAPADGDTVSIAGNAPGQGDARNALLLGALQTTNTINGGTTTFQGAYSQMVANVGSKAREVQATSAAAITLLQQATANQQSVAGVNLDEEAATLLKYQHAYQAAGKLMQTANTLFSTILNL